MLCKQVKISRDRPQPLLLVVMVVVVEVVVVFFFSSISLIQETENKGWGKKRKRGERDLFQHEQLSESLVQGPKQQEECLRRLT